MLGGGHFAKIAAKKHTVMCRSAELGLLAEAGQTWDESERVEGRPAGGEAFARGVHEDEGRAVDGEPDVKLKARVKLG